MNKAIFWSAYAKLCKKRSRTYVGSSRFYYGCMNHIQDDKWRACHD